MSVPVTPIQPSLVGRIDHFAATHFTQLALSLAVAGLLVGSVAASFLTNDPTRIVSTASGRIPTAIEGQPTGQHRIQGVSSGNPNSAAAPIPGAPPKQVTVSFGASSGPRPSTAPADGECQLAQPTPVPSPSGTVPSDAVPSDAVPSDAVPSDAVPSNAAPAAMLPPAAIDDSVMMMRRTAKHIQVLDNDQSGSSSFDPLSLEIVSAPSHAVRSFVAGTNIVYESGPVFEGDDRLIYRICDLNNLCSQASLVVAVGD